MTAASTLEPPPGPRRAPLRFALGLACGVAAVALPAELYLRLAPPADLMPYLGQASDLTGPYVADPVLGAAYRSYDDFHALYAERLAELERDRAGRPVWAMFGNSFVQAPGMLGDTAQALLPGRQIFYLRRNEPLNLRVAQLRLLLEQGLAPQRIVFTFVPIELYGIASTPLDSLAVTPGGGLGRHARAPGWLAPTIDTSRLALAAWVRSGRQAMLPGFRPRDVMRPLPDLVRADLDRLLGEIGRLGAVYGVPVTAVFIPNREQIMGDPVTTPQDAIGAAARAAGLDFLDASPAFLAEDDKADLLIPDGHLSDRGNRVLLDAILAHLGEPAP